MDLKFISVTIEVDGGGRREIEIPADDLIVDYLAHLVEAQVGGDADVAQWCLIADGRVLSEESTLRAAGVVDGAVLCLAGKPPAPTARSSPDRLHKDSVMSAGPGAPGFTRVTIRGQRGCEDYFLPSSEPLSMQLGELLPVAVDAAETGGDQWDWGLATVDLGRLPAGLSLSELGIEDGQVLYVAGPRAVVKPPFTDEMRAARDDTWRSPRVWRGRCRVRELAVLTAVVFGIWGVAAAFGLNAPWDLIVPLALAAVSTGLGVVDRQGDFRWCVAASVPLLCASGWLVAETVGLTPATVALVGAFAGLAVCTALRLLPRTAGAVATAVSLVLVVVSALLKWGTNAIALSAWSVPILVMVVVTAPRMATAVGGLLPAVAVAEDGELAAVADIRRGVRRTADILDAAIWTAAILLAIALCVVATTEVWVQGILVPVAALAAVFVARQYSQVRHVVPLVVCGLVAMLVSVIAMPWWFDVTGAGEVAGMVVGVVVVGIALAPTPFIALSPHSAAHLSRVYDVIGVVVIVAVVPVVFLAQGVYQVYWPD
ncbi:MAG: EsaB/YukD family protein [Gordonia sp. (in: high G+C Gram-positive bacteria)]